MLVCRFKLYNYCRTLELLQEISIIALLKVEPQNDHKIGLKLFMLSSATEKCIYRSISILILSLKHFVPLELRSTLQLNNNLATIFYFNTTIWWNTRAHTEIYCCIGEVLFSDICKAWIIIYVDIIKIKWIDVCFGLCGKKIELDIKYSFIKSPLGKKCFSFFRCN